MTPTEQDKELREKLESLVEKNAMALCCNDCNGGGYDYENTKDCSTCNGTGLTEWRNDYLIDTLMQLITADRKRVALEARLDENEEWRLFSKEAQRGILPTDFKARMITLKEPYQLSEAQQEEA